MRIAMVAHNFVRGNGQGRIQYEIVLGTLRRGHAVTLLADNVSPELIRAGATSKRVRQSPRRPNLFGAYLFAARADRAVREVRREFDLLVAAGFTTREEHDVSICQFVHGAYLKLLGQAAEPGCLRRVYQGLYTRCNARWEKEAYGGARFVVAPSSRTRDDLIEIGVPAVKVRLIHNGIDPEEFKPGPEDRAALGLPADVPLALFVGDIRTRRKNLDTALRALCRLPDVHLAVVGDATRSPFPSAARELGVGDRAHFLGFRSDVPRIMRATDVFVFPTRYEPFGLVVLEALASGLPVVTTRAAGAADLMTPRCGAVIESPDDVAGLASAVARFATPGPARAGAPVAAREVARNHSWSAMADRYVDLFEEATASRN